MNILVVGSSIFDIILEIEDKSQAETADGKVFLKLGDKIPVDINKLALGGDGADISVGLKRLSVDSTFYTFLGEDIFSKKIEQTLNKESVNLIAIREGENSSISLIVNFDRDRIIFSHRELREHDFSYEGKNPDFVYLSSMGEKWEEAYKKVLNFVKNNNIPLGFTPGSPQLKKNSDILMEVLKSSKIVFVNRQEAEKILRFQNIQYTDIKDVLFKVKNPGMEVLSVTDGLAGAYAMNQEGDFYFIEPFKNNTVDRVGAGDAYTSGFLSGYLLGMGIGECMRRGAFNSHSVVLKTGAQDGLLRKEEMDKMMEENREFKAEKI
ncbi:MAG: carbohydrate kinase family protein [Candidatus Levybacteria bacterium]|nr:carbohydrate kinase family protein [Candidatus Levybacteria bacterium]